MHCTDILLMCGRHLHMHTHTRTHTHTHVRMHMSIISLLYVCSIWDAHTELSLVDRQRLFVSSVDIGRSSNDYASMNSGRNCSILLASWNHSQLHDMQSPGICHLNLAIFIIHSLWQIEGVSQFSRENGSAMIDSLILVSWSIFYDHSHATAVQEFLT